MIIRSLLIVSLSFLSSCALFSWIDGKEATPSKDLTKAKHQKLLKEAEVKKRIVVLTFLNKTPYGGKQLANHASQNVRKSITNMDQFVLVNEETLGNRSSFITLNDTFNYKTIFEAAENKDIDGIVLGKISDIQFEGWGDEVGIFRSRFYKVNAKVEYRVFDLETTQMLLSDNNSAQVVEEHTKILNYREPQVYNADRAKSAVAKALKKLRDTMPTFAKRIGWRGRIAKASIPRYYINAGEKTGINVGSFLKVFEKGTPITDGKHGKPLGIAPGRFKGMLRVIEMMGNDAAIAIAHSGSGFRENDRVQLYVKKDEDFFFPWPTS